MEVFIFGCLGVGLFEFSFLLKKGMCPTSVALVDYFASAYVISCCLLLVVNTVVCVRTS